SSLPASLRISARPTYMPFVIAFFFSGRLNWTRRMPLERSVMMSLMVCFLADGSARRLGRTLACRGDRTAFAQARDALGVEAELAENLLGVLAEVGSAAGRSFRDAMHLDRAADRGGQLAAGPLEGNDDFVFHELRIVDHLLRSAHLSKGDVQ